MKTEQILNLDYREEKNKEIIQKVLRKIKPLSKFSDEEEIPLVKIEKLIQVLCLKYAITPQWMNMVYSKDVPTIYSISVKTTTKHEWLGNVYGVCLYEVFAKLAIKIYSEIKSGKVEEKTTSKEEKQRERIAKKIDKEEAL